MEHLNEPRERQAAEELGHTEVRTGVAAGLVGAFLATLLGVFAVDAPRGPSAAALLSQLPDDCTLQAFERRLEDESAVARALRPHVQTALLRLGAGNEQAYVGRDGWLFHRPGFDYVTGPGFLDPARLRARVEDADPCSPVPAPDPVEAIASLAEQLAARGIALIAVPTPVKAVVHPGRLSERYGAGTAPVQNPSWEAFVAALEARGVDVFDPTPLLGAADSYLPTDTHWRAAAMEAVADALAERIEARVAFARPRAPLVRGTAEVENLGDLTTMLSLPAGQDRLPPERVATRPVAAASAPDAEVLLLGDSFSNIYSSREAFAQEVGGRRLDWGASAGLGEQLAFALGRPVERLVQNAGGADATRDALAREVAREAAAGRDRLADLRVVVYQFAMRELAQGDWREIALAEAPAAAQPPLPREAAAAGPLRWRGTLAARSPVPRPGTVPYRDAVFAAHLRGLRAVGEGDPAPPEEAVVYLFGMRDGRLTAPAAWRPGEVVTVEVSDWEDPSVQGRYGSYNRTELDDLDLLLLPSFWAEPIEGKGEGE